MKSRSQSIGEESGRTDRTIDRAKSYGKKMICNMEIKMIPPQAREQIIRALVVTIAIM